MIYLLLFCKHKRFTNSTHKTRTEVDALKNHIVITIFNTKSSNTILSLYLICINPKRC